jgi:tetratricopeptide (TPR) repeat protein
MNDATHEEALKAYVERILALKSQKAAALSDDELRAIALDLGLTEADLAAGQEAAERSFQRGEGYLRHRRWGDAIHDLSAAAALAPGRVDVLHALAQAHAGRWKSERTRADREEAEAVSRRVLDLAPGHEASFVLLNDLDAPSRTPGPDRWVNGRAIRPIALAIVVFGLLTLLTTQWRRDRQRDVPPPVPPAAQQPNRPAVAPLVEVPVELTSDAKSAGMKLETRLSELSNYSTSSYHQQAIALTNTGKAAWQELVVQADFLDAKGRLLHREPIKALQDHEPEVRPGDLLVFNHLQKSTPQLAKVRLQVTLRRELPMRALKVMPKPLTVDWAIERPAGVNLGFKERSGTVSRSAMFDTVYMKPIVEIENTGDVAVKTVRMELTTFDEAGKQLTRKDHLAVSGAGMALLPGETRLDHWHESVPKTYHHYQLKVIEVE